MVTPVIVKQPAEKLPVTLDFTRKLATGDSLTGSPTLAADAGLTVDGAAVATPRVTVDVSGGTDGTTYRVHCRMGTTLGKVLELDVDVRVRDGEN